MGVGLCLRVKIWGSDRGGLPISLPSRLWSSVCVWGGGCSPSFVGFNKQTEREVHS